MIAVDASALLAIILREPDGPRYASILAEADSACMSVTSAFETASKLFVVGGDLLERELEFATRTLSITVLPADLAQLAEARAAFRRYGKGRGHPAQLNFGDCFSYALAKTRDLPLLYKGNDFIHTDIVSVLA